MAQLRLYDVARPSLRKTFPDSIEVPPLLDALCAFLAKKPHGSLGYFDAIAGAPLPEALADDDAATARLQTDLAIFLMLADGSHIALWRHGTRSLPAVVLLGSEGELTNLAPTFEAFLIAWTKGTTKVGDLDEETDVPSAREALAAWLAKRGVREPTAKKNAIPVPRFSTWFKSTAKEAITKRDAAAKASVAAARKGSPRRQRVALAEPAEAARNALALGERTLDLLEKRTDAAEIIEVMAGLGVDIAALKKPDALRFLIVPTLGLGFEFDWPWEYNDDISKAERASLKAAGVRTLGMIEFCTAGYTTKNLAIRSEVTFAGYQGAMPWGVAFDDKRAALAKKLGEPTLVLDDSLWWTDKVKRRRTIAGFNDQKEVKTSLAYFRCAVHLES